MVKPLKYSKVKVIKITETQYNTLERLKKYKVNVSKFIREAIQEKLERNKKDILLEFNESKKEYCPF